MIALGLALLLAASPPCSDAHVRPARCQIPSGWICLSPELAGAAEADRVAAAKRCEAEKTALEAEASTVLRRELAKKGVDIRTATTKIEEALAVARLAEEALREAEAEASSRWSTLEVVGLIAGAVVVGAVAGSLAGFYGSR